VRARAFAFFAPFMVLPLLLLRGARGGGRARARAGVTWMQRSMSGSTRFGSDLPQHAITQAAALRRAQLTRPAQLTRAEGAWSPCPSHTSDSEEANGRRARARVGGEGRGGERLQGAGAARDERTSRRCAFG
jgi:hypothetical protein